MSELPEPSTDDRDGEDLSSEGLCVNKDPQRALVAAAAAQPSELRSAHHRAEPRELREGEQGEAGAPSDPRRGGGDRAERPRVHHEPPPWFSLYRTSPRRSSRRTGRSS